MIFLVLLMVVLKLRFIALDRVYIKIKWEVYNYVK